jgi:16S rRNA (cytosine967-C5)-methyltransferase
VEKHFPRARALKDNLARLGATVAEVVNADALKLPFQLKFDRILLDAPCSGLGVINKRVDLKWKRTPEEIEQMHQLQVNLLESAASYLKDGGVLVYSTCTIEPRENEDSVAEFLDKHPDFVRDEVTQLVPPAYCWSKNVVRTFPHKHKMDGSFAVRLVKKG